MRKNTTFERACLIAVLSFSIAGDARSQADSSRSSSPLFSKRDAALAGGFLVATLAAAPGDRYFAKLLQDSANQSDPLIRLMSTDVSIFGRPGLLIIGSSLFVVGKVARKEGLAHFGLHATEAMLVTEVVNGGLKVAAGRARPRENIDRPFDFSFGRGLKKSRIGLSRRRTRPTPSRSRRWRRKRSIAPTRTPDGVFAVTGVCRRRGWWEPWPTAARA